MVCGSHLFKGPAASLGGETLEASESSKQQNGANPALYDSTEENEKVTIEYLKFCFRSSWLV